MLDPALEKKTDFYWKDNMLTWYENSYLNRKKMEILNKKKKYIKWYKSKLCMHCVCLE